MTYTMGFCTGHALSQWSPPAVSQPPTDAPLVIDQKRMDEALSSPRHLMPRGLTREQRRAEFLKVAQQVQKQRLG